MDNNENNSAGFRIILNNAGLNVNQTNFLLQEIKKVYDKSYADIVEEMLVIKLELHNLKNSVAPLVDKHFKKKYNK